MVLLVGDKEFRDCGAFEQLRNSDFQEVFDAFPDESNFDASGEVHINSSNDILYVHQGEMAVVKYNSTGNVSLPPYAGTSEMTSCQAVVLTSSIGFSICHLDGSNFVLTKNFFDTSLENLNQLGQECTDVHIVGGFLDVAGHSKKLISQILYYLFMSSLRFRLKTFFCYFRNDRIRTTDGTQIHEPIVRDVVFCIETRQLKSASVNANARGPLSVLRNASLYSSSSQLHSILDPVSHILRLKEFSIPISTMVFLSRRAKATNSQLQNFSTTPQNETAHFYDMLRRTGEFMAYLLDTGWDFFENGDLEFSYDCESKRWAPLNPQTEEALKHPLTSF